MDQARYNDIKLEQHAGTYVYVSMPRQTGGWTRRAGLVLKSKSSQVSDR